MPIAAANVLESLPDGDAQADRYCQRPRTIRDLAGCGRDILAHDDEASFVIYQAYRPSIGPYAICRHGAQRTQVSATQQASLCVPAERDHEPIGVNVRRSTKVAP